MTTAILLGFALIALVLYVRAPIKLALAILLIVTFLIPGDLLLYRAPNIYMTIHRLVLLMFCLNILLRVVARDIPASVLRPNRLTVILYAWVAIMFVMGVALSTGDVTQAGSIFVWMFAVEQLLFVYFVVAAIRAIGDVRWVAWLVVGVMLGTAGIAVGEHFAKQGLGPYLKGVLSGRPHFHEFNNLSRRGGDVRVQAGLDFSLAYAWVATCMLPLAIAMTSRSKSFIVRVLPGVIVLSIAWTYARSAYIGVPLGVLILVLGMRLDARVMRIVVGGTIVAGVVVLLTPAVAKTFRSADVAGSTQIREERLPIILSQTAERPLIGRGYGSVPASGFGTTDSTFLLVYGEVGVLGAAALGMLFLGTVASLLPALRAPPRERLIGAAAFAGVIAGLLSAAFLDTFSISGSFRSFWLLAALGSVVADQVRQRDAVERPQTVRRPAVRWIALPAAMATAGGAIGFAVLAATPSTMTATVRFTTVSAAAEGAARGPQGFVARTNVNTACQIIEARVAADPPDRADCYDMLTQTGVADVRIEAPDRIRLERRIAAIRTAVKRFLAGSVSYRLYGDGATKPTVVETAPAWLAFVGLALGLLLASSPPFRDRIRLVGFFGDQLWPAPAR